NSYFVYWAFTCSSPCAVEERGASAAIRRSAGRTMRSRRRINWKVMECRPRSRWARLFASTIVFGAGRNATGVGSKVANQAARKSEFRISRALPVLLGPAEDLVEDDGLAHGLGVGQQGGKAGGGRGGKRAGAGSRLAGRGGRGGKARPLELPHAVV